MRPALSSLLTRPLAALALAWLGGCAGAPLTDAAGTPETVGRATAQADPAAWPALSPPPLDPEVEARVDEIMSRMTLAQKVGQIIQADTDSVTPEEVKRYRLGSVLSGGNSAPGEAAYAEADAWLDAADAYYRASIDPEGVDIAIPVIWGIDAVHGHANLTGATVFPHNIGLGAAHDPDLIERIMEVTASELIVSGHDWTFAPTLAVPRDDRWGRTYEGFSEDPALVASYADRIVHGLQGRPGTPGYFGANRVISTAKHFVGDGGTTRGVDQGDTAISQAELRDIHAAGYFPAIEAGVQSVMASFNSWNGTKMHGNKTMLSDVLKTRMGFNGFVVGDWNGHGQIKGCTNTDCPQALLAGVDMYMAPDSWKGIYETTLAGVRAGDIPMSRLDDAVRRILRVKVTSGLFERPRPSARPGAGDVSRLGSPAHRSVAREAVRKSLVLLKNDDATLPIDPGATILVVGDGADSIARQSGGWTLSWQGGDHANGEFPNGQSILDGIREVVSAEGGRLIFDAAGTSQAAADAVIAVYGEAPYAEFQGDRTHLDFTSEGVDAARLDGFRKRGIPVVSVFLSGRPLWVNPEINASDAFVAAWLPGTEGGGVADLLFRRDPDFDFTGRLSFSWPATAADFANNAGSPDYDPLFPIGYGLSYGDESEVATLSEQNGLEALGLVEPGGVFRRGGTLQPWRAFLVSGDEAVVFNGMAANLDGLAAGRADHVAQEDALSLDFSADGNALAFLPDGASVDWSRELAEGMGLAFAIRSARGVDLRVAMGCGDAGPCKAETRLDIAPGQWRETLVPLACFAGQGIDFGNISSALRFSAPAGTQFDLADIRLKGSGERTCPE
jgi:beta-glucosidase